MSIRWRRVGVEVLAGALAVSGVGASAAAGAAVSPAIAQATLADWPTQGRPGGWGDPYGSGGGTATVDSDPATAVESEGVVLVETVVGFSAGQGAGTGIVLTATGQVVTNYHVVEGASEITVTVTTSGTAYEATVVGRDATNDVALLQLEDASGLTVADLDDDTVEVGDEVTAVGNAGGTGTLTAADGSVTSLDASVSPTDASTGETSTLSGMIETDADVVSGQSGGPLLDAEGEVVGIDTAASSGAEINGYAIPINRALAVVEQILAGQETSTVQIGANGYLGVSVTGPVAYGSPSGSGGSSASGAVIASVVDGTPAAELGLAAGDVVTAVGSTAISSAAELSATLAGYDAGETVEITWIDASEAQHTESVALAASPVA